jgi:hypothetical protein
MPRWVTVDENGIVVSVESVPERASRPIQSKWGWRKKPKKSEPRAIFSGGSLDL